MQTQDIKERIAYLRQSYTRLALECRARGVRVNSQTVANYAREIQALEIQLV